MPRKLLKLTAARRQHRTSRLIARNLRDRRRQLGINLTRVANRMAVTERQVLRWESGETRISCGALAMMAQVFGNMPGDFFINPFPSD